jgi:septal ring factor EnvC (AmiA/AmiB activator)
MNDSLDSNINNLIVELAKTDAKIIKATEDADLLRRNNKTELKALSDRTNDLSEQLIRSRPVSIYGVLLKLQYLAKHNDYLSAILEQENADPAARLCFSAIRDLEHLMHVIAYQR